MKELQLKYGCNPNQKPSRIYMNDGSELPIKVLSGKPGYINFLDAFNGWQLVSNLKQATGLPAATSFKHVSPAGAAVGLPLSETLAKIYWVDDMDWKNFSPIACAYARARGADRMSSFGDFISLSDVCDKDTAMLIKREVSDGVIAPGYTPEALEILAKKKKGNYNVIQIDPDYVPAPLEHKEVFGVTFEQGRQELAIDDELISNLVTKNKELTEEAKRDMKISLIILKYTQSNSVCFVKGGQAIGVGAGQQSRVHCTRLAGQKADNWFLRQSPKVLNLPFRRSHRRILFCSVYLIISCLSGTLIDQNKSYVGLISADRSYTGVYPYIVFHRHVIISVCRFQTAFLSEDAVDITVYQCSIIIILLNQKICRIGTVYPFRTIF